jgi:hypothetical protein
MCALSLSPFLSVAQRELKTKKLVKMCSREVVVVVVVIAILHFT